MEPHRVESDDDEPLYEIKRVESVFKEKKAPKIVSAPSSKYVKVCYVPLCPNSTRTTPEKMFITVPVNPVRRKVWLEKVGKTSEGRNPKSPMFCCQDHFDLRRDMKNYSEYLCRGKVQMHLYKTAVPSIFLCDEYPHLTRTQRIQVLRELHGEQHLQEEFVTEDNELTITRLTPRQKMIDAKRKKMEQEKTVFLKMPEFDNDDTDFIHIITEPDPMDTIVIDDDE